MSQRLRTCLWGTVLGFFLGFSATACLVSGLAIPVSLWTVALWCLLGAAVCAFCCGYRLGLIPVALWAVLLGYLWQSDLLAMSFGGLLYEISLVWHDVCGWQIMRLGVESLAEAREVLPIALYLLGGAVAMVTAWSVAKGQSAVPAVLLAAPMPVLTMLIIGKVPEIIWVFLLLVCLCLLVLCSGVRYRDEKQGNRVTFYGILPVILVIALLLLMIPAKTYTGDERAEKWADVLFHDTGLKDWWERLTEKEIPPAESVDGVKVSLDQLGPRNLSETQVMTVTAGYTGTLYLRTSALDTYDGKTWTNSGDGTTLPWPNSQNLQSGGEVMVSTEYAHRMMYLPYYVRSMNMSGLARGIENEYKLNYYTIACAQMPDKSYFEDFYADPYTNRHTAPPEFMAQCTQLPDLTKKWADGILPEILGDTVNYYHVAQKICRYVRTGAKYDLNPEMMGEKEKDFVRWFVEQSETGYCVHYASAAAVLLKAAGIPARYVSGYMVEVQAGVNTPVLQSNAHAWVEYWLPGFGWTILEATPADESEYIPRNREQTVQQQPEQESWNWPGWTLWLLPGAVLLGLGGYHVLLSRKRKRRLTKGTTNARLLAHWAEYEALMLLLKDTPDGACLALAEKAKFSPYTITEDELEQMDCAMAAAKGQLRTRNVFLRLKWLKKRNRVF